MKKKMNHPSAIETDGAVAASSIQMPMNGKISLYFHIPFCTKKCDYCHFYVLPDKDPFKQQLMQGFRKEWQLRLPVLKGKSVESIYFGGGTPALMGAEAIATILTWIKKDLVFASPEITLEANPENITADLMRSYQQAGINRVSIGIQTLEDRLLHSIGRTHNAQKAIDSVLLTADAGIKNISVDLMYDLPQQTLVDWHNTLLLARDLPILHLSLYNLTIEPQTVFFKYKDTLQTQLPDEQTSLNMYQAAIEMLQDRGLHQYEISAFAKQNSYSRHNVGYWTARPFLGFGPSAFSYWKGKRFRNIANLSKYCQLLDKGAFPIDFEEQLDENAAKKELLVIELRLLRGVDLEQFQLLYGNLDEVTLRNIEQLKQEEMLFQEGNVIKLTRQGVLFYDTLASDLI